MITNRGKNRSLYLKLMSSRRWVDLRNNKIRAQPLCERCLLNNRTTLAQEVHHKEPVEGAATDVQAIRLAYDYSNLMSVCRKCHYELHKEMRRHSRVVGGLRPSTQRFINTFLKQNDE